VHCQKGDEILVADNAHILQSEGGGIAMTAGALVSPVPSERGIFSDAALSAAIRPQKLRAPQPRVVAIEQTTNRGGGAVWPLEGIGKIVRVARERGLSLHMDGARLMNAAVAARVPPRDFAREVDSCWLDLTKGLGCPVGAVLVGSRVFIDQAWFWKHQLGGAMRQAGILAAAGLYALEHHVDRLETDHRNARLLADLLARLPGISLAMPNIETNIVLFDLDLAPRGCTAADLAAALRKQGVRLRAESAVRCRAITHLDVSEDQVRAAATSIGETLAHWQS
jgi:threonine aldolase